ncbi:MAG TPA: site-specific integrase [Gaiellaceae bacterium]|nr:site-specific integrase [Gaiellaceae bacterium]
MARPAKGSVVERDGTRDRTFALRFRAYGKREYMTLGAIGKKCALCGDPLTKDHAKQELEYVLADVRRGIWRPPVTETVETPAEVPTFHEFATAWLERMQSRGLGVRTIEYYRWALVLHLLPDFGSRRLDAITKQLVDAYATAKLQEGVLGAGSINKTITLLSQVLADALEYELVTGNVAAGRRRRLKAAKPRRPWIEPEQLMALLEAAEPILQKRGRPLLATLAGAGLRIGEALALRWRDVNLARGTLSVGQAKTAAGVRIVDLTPALREELTLWRDTSKHASPDDYVFPTLRGTEDNRQNVRQRLLLPAIEKANVKLADAGIETIGSVGLHGLRRTFASLRCAAGDDVAYTSAQIGHEDALFTLRTYTAAVKRRDRLTAGERAAFDRAVEWARMGTNDAEVTVESIVGAAPLEAETAS